MVYKQRKLLYMIVFGFMILFSCTTFPIYNFTHKISKTLTVINFIIPIAAFREMGMIEAGLFPDRSVAKMIFLKKRLLCPLCGLYKSEDVMIFKAGGVGV